MRISGQGIKMCATDKPLNIRDMTKEMEQAEMRLKASILRNVTLPLSSTSNAAGTGSPSESKMRGSTPWIKYSIKRQGMN